MTVGKSFYECVFIARQDLAAPEAHKLADKFSEIIESHEGKVLKREYWGLRTLEYEIKKNRKGHYIALSIQAGNDAVKEFERNCKINEDVIKYLTIRVESVSDQPSQMMQAPLKATVGATNDEIPTK